MLILAHSLRTVSDPVVVRTKAHWPRRRLGQKANDPISTTNHGSLPKSKSASSMSKFAKRKRPSPGKCASSRLSMEGRQRPKSRSSQRPRSHHRQPIMMGTFGKNNIKLVSSLISLQKMLTMVPFHHCHRTVCCRQQQQPQYPRAQPRAMTRALLPLALILPLMTRIMTTMGTR